MTLLELSNFVFKGSMSAVAIFDLDGTLIDSARCSVEATRQSFIEIGLLPPEEAKIIDLMGVPIEQSFRMMGADSFSEQKFGDFLNLFREKYRAIAAAGIRAFPGMPELLGDLQSRGMKVAVATSKHSKVAHQNLEAAGLLGNIDSIVGSDHVQNYKPHPESIFVALSQLQVAAPRRATMTGDATVDIEMGRAASVFTCAVTWGAHSEDKLKSAFPDSISSSVDALRETLIEQLS